MATSRGDYGLFSVDYVVIRKGEQELDPFSLFVNQTQNQRNSHCNYPSEKPSRYIILNLESQCDEDYPPPMDKQQLVNSYCTYITNRLRELSKPDVSKQRRCVLFVSSSYIPIPLIGVTVGRPDTIPCFFNCFKNVYIVDGESFCSSRFLNKWKVESSLPRDLQDFHVALEAYRPVNFTQDQTNLWVYSPAGEAGEALNLYLVNQKDHVLYYRRAVRVMKLQWQWESSYQEGREERHSDYAYETRHWCGTVLTYIYHSLKSKLLQTELTTLLTHLFGPNFSFGTVDE